MATFRPLLRKALATMDEVVAGPAVSSANRALEMLSATLDVDLGEGSLPVVMQLPEQQPENGETWPEYKDRVSGSIHAANDALTGSQGTPLFLANAIAAKLEPQQIRGMQDTDAVQSIELDRLVQVTAMDNAVEDVGLETFRATHGALTGSGVSVAVLDSGIDSHHPHLSVQDAVSTCGESVDIPGRHGTHCAGSIASRDQFFQGIAPDVTLYNVKVLRSNGTGTSTFVTQGIDKALDFEADILSMSLGFNHLPAWSNGGHGWSCPDGKCELCTAVDNAVFFGAAVVVAAGNEHERAQALRNFGHGNSFDTELGCPGHARRAITVGAHTKSSFQPASFTSHGPTSYGAEKPEIAATGVNVTSTVPVPRTVSGQPVSAPLRSQLFDRESGTSMATPIAAGALALLMQDRRQNGMSTEPADLASVLLADAVTETGFSRNILGLGRVDLSRYGTFASVAQGGNDGGNQQT